MAHGTATYRPDVDGLRAVAILTVVAYHAGLPGFPGGFVGVDVFFVISGYLITGLMLQEAGRTGRIDLWAFYARRVRRLLPAFLLVLFSSLALGALLLSPIGGEYQALAKSGIAALAFNANHYFIATTGRYFDGPADLQPMLHTWSLSVEEQFYVVWPLFLIALLRLTPEPAAFRRRVTAALGLVLIGSFALSATLTPTAPKLAFYLMATRAWELAAGAMLALLPAAPALRLSPRFGGAFGAGGLVLIGAATLAFGPETPFPGVWASVPVVGAVAVILGNSYAPASWAARLLASRPFVLVGLVSYSWYLWHWPLLAIARTTSLGERDVVRDVALSLLALLLATLTYKFVEGPLRRSPRSAAASPVRVVGAGALASVAAASLTLALGLWGKYGTFSPEIQALMTSARDVAPSRSRCNIDNDAAWTGRMPPEECWQSKAPGNGVVVVWGDSHASQWVSFAEAVREQGWGVLPRTMSACAPLAAGTSGKSPLRADCLHFNLAVLDEIQHLARERPVTVIGAARWLHLDMPPDALRVHLDATFTRLSEAGVRVLWILPPPQLRHPAPACLARRSAEECGISRNAYLAERARVEGVSAGVARRFSNVQLFDPADVFCARDVCPARKDGVVQFFDDNHPTDRALRRAAADAAPVWDWVLRGTRLPSPVAGAPAGGTRVEHYHPPSQREPT